jgi:hypothetical protein
MNFIVTPFKKSSQTLINMNTIYKQFYVTN